MKNRTRVQVYKINKESLTNFSQFISLKVKKILRKGQAQFREKLRKLKLRQNYGFLIKEVCSCRQEENWAKVASSNFHFIPLSNILIYNLSTVQQHIENHSLVLKYLYFRDIFLDS